MDDTAPGASAEGIRVFGVVCGDGAEDSSLHWGPSAPSRHCQVYVAPNPGKLKHSKYSAYWGEAMKSIPVVLRNLGSDLLELILNICSSGVGVVRRH